MRRVTHARILAVLFVFTAVWMRGQRLIAQSPEIDFVAMLLRDSTLAPGLDLRQLSAGQRSALNRLLNSVYRLGGRPDPSGQPVVPPIAAPRPGSAAAGRVIRAYASRIQEEKGDVLSLENGAIVAVTTGYIGYVGYRKHVLVLLAGGSCRIAIAGKRSYRCSLVREPSRSARTAELVTLSEVRDNGGMLLLTDGRILDVDRIGRIYTMLWLPVSELAILDGIEVVNLDDPEEPISISRIR